MDHIVLVVTDVERSVAWYRDQLQLEVLRLDEWRAGDAPFPSVRINEGTIIDIIAGDRSGKNVDHFCLVIEPTDLGELAANGGFEVVEGPVTRWGARGDGTSVYVTDPDGNVISSATTNLRYPLPAGGGRRRSAMLTAPRRMAWLASSSRRLSTS